MANYRNYCGTGGCFDSSKRPVPKDTILASFWGTDVDLPKIGDSITVFAYGATTTTETVVLTKENYADSLIKWIRYNQITCFEGNKDANGTFFPRMQIFGTQPQWEEKSSEFGFDEDKGVDYVTNTTSYKIPQGIYNQGFFNNITKNVADISVIDFLEEGVYVYPYGDSEYEFTSRLRKASTPLGDSNASATAMADIYHKGDVPPIFYPTSSKRVFSKEITKATEFGFSDTLTNVTGLTSYACTSRGKCLTYSGTENTAFTFKNEMLEKDYSTCVSWELLKCGTGDKEEILDAVLAAKVAINPSTGEVIAPAGLPLGTYTFIIKAKNSCCVEGTYCVQITVI